MESKKTKLRYRKQISGYQRERGLEGWKVGDRRERGWVVG